MSLAQNRKDAHLSSNIIQSSISPYRWLVGSATTQSGWRWQVDTNWNFESWVSTKICCLSFPGKVTLLQIEQQVQVSIEGKSWCTNTTDRQCESNQAHRWLHCSINKSLYSFCTKFSTLGWPVGIILLSKPSPYISYYMLPSFLVVLQVHFGEAGEQNASVKDKGDNEEVQADVAEDYKDL